MTQSTPREWQSFLGFAKFPLLLPTMGECSHQIAAHTKGSADSSLVFHRIFHSQVQVVHKAREMVPSKVAGSCTDHVPSITRQSRGQCTVSQRYSSSSTSCPIGHTSCPSGRHHQWLAVLFLMSPNSTLLLLISASETFTLTDFSVWCTLRQMWPDLVQHKAN